MYQVIIFSARSAYCAQELTFFQFLWFTLQDPNSLTLRKILYHIGQHGSVHPEDPGPDLLASPAAATGGWAGDCLEAQAHEEVRLLPCRDRGVLLLHRDCQRRQSHPPAHWQWILSSRYLSNASDLSRKIMWPEFWPLIGQVISWADTGLWLVQKWCQL